MDEGPFEDSRDSPLLGLPAEIRNSIYRLALVEDIIRITPQNLAGASQPPLLQVNRQIRSEATSIYYQENQIIWYLQDYNAKNLLKWEASSEVRSETEIRVNFEGKPIWTNVLEWLKAAYEGEVNGVELRNDGHGDSATHVVARMFAILDDESLEWEEVERILGGMRMAAGVYDPAWLEDT